MSDFITRREQYLAYIAGESDTYPDEPITREETFLAEIALRIASGGTGGSGGVGILKIQKTSTNGLVDTYTITYTDNTKSTFTVTNGKDGLTPYIKDGNWWIGDTDTGVKAEGKDGANGVDGKNGENGKDGANGTNGADGKDGISATHSWNGTTLTITSASGTSSANLKGADGKDGVDGKDGTDIVVSLTKKEFSKLTSSDIAQYYNSGIRLVCVEDEYTNLLPTAISENGSVYFGCGYQNGVRLNSSGEIIKSRQSCVTGFIPCIAGSQLTVYGSKGPLGTHGNYVAGYDANFALLGVYYMESMSGISAIADEKNLYTYSCKLSASAFTNATYIRISLNPCEGRDIIVQMGGETV